MRRIRRIMVWLGATGFILSAATWLLSLRYEATWHNTRDLVCIREGGLRLESLPAGASYEAGGALRIQAQTYTTGILWKPGYSRGHLDPSVINGFHVSWRTIFPTTYDVPLWPLPLVFLAVSLLGVRPCRRRRPGQCAACGYSLTGNISGVCPECGTTVWSSSEV